MGSANLPQICKFNCLFFIIYERNFSNVTDEYFFNTTWNSQNSDQPISRKIKTRRVFSIEKRWILLLVISNISVFFISNKKKHGQKFLLITSQVVIYSLTSSWRPLLLFSPLLSWTFTTESSARAKCRTVSKRFVSKALFKPFLKDSQLNYNIWEFV